MYLCATIKDNEGQGAFSHDSTDNIDYINAAGEVEFFAEIWEAEKGNMGPIATPQSLLELKAFAFIQHCQNGFWQKADDAEFDIKFLCRTFNLNTSGLQILPRYASKGEMAEVVKVIASVKR